MAICIPETIRRTATTGERLVFRTLKNYLPDDYIVYYEPDIKGVRPDFVIIGPDIGLIVLEVKDYKKSTLISINQDEWELYTTNGEQHTVTNPVLQAKNNMFHISDGLKRDTNLINHEGKYRYRLKFPCGYGAVFTRMYQRDFIEENLYHVVPPQLSLTRDEIDPDHENFDEGIFVEKILNMFTVRFRLKEPLSYEDVNAIRYHLFPEVRISAKFKEVVPHQEQLLLSLRDIKTMDLHQEKLAKQLGDKNRLIRGVAGSGKTLILVSRAKLLAKEHPDWKVLILCYNISLAQSIRQMLRYMFEEQMDLFDLESDGDDHTQHLKNIQVYNFHAWLKQELKLSDSLIPSIVEKVKQKEVILPQYDAILIDEGQDFEPEWFQLVSNLLNPETKSLLLVEDRAQDIYKRKRSYIQDTGLDFRGRSKILNINYRNTSQIVEFAWNFYQNHSSLKNKVKEKRFEGEIIAPKSTLRKGPEPAIIKRDNFRQEMEMLVRIIKNLHQDKKVPFDEMVILYRVKRDRTTNYIDMIQYLLKRMGIPYYWMTENAGTKRNYEKSDGKVKISTIDSSKGLDFQAVFIVNIDNMPFALEDDPEREASLLYIAMTRAQNYLTVSYSGESEFTGYFDQVLEDRQVNEKRTILSMESRR